MFTKMMKTFLRCQSTAPIRSQWRLCLHTFWTLKGLGGVKHAPILVKDIILKTLFKSIFFKVEYQGITRVLCGANWNVNSNEKIRYKLQYCIRFCFILLKQVLRNLNENCAEHNWFLTFYIVICINTGWWLTLTNLAHRLFFN